MINNDTEFRQALDELDLAQQRVIAACFTENVLTLTTDERPKRVVNSVIDGQEIEEAFKLAKAASLEAHARCGTEGDWSDQAGYFVARAAQAAVEPQVRSGGKNPAWKAAMQARMARTCLASEAEEDSHDRETIAQYHILNDYLGP